MTHLIADTFYDALAKLTPQEQKQVKTSAFDFQMDPSLPGLQMHRVDRARDPNFWTARVNRDIRMVIHKKEGQSLLAWVGHHDAAYRWAETRRIESHPRTGAIQIVEARETIEEVVIQRYVEKAIELPRPLAEHGDDTLLSWGVPTDWLDTVRDATEETVLDIAGHLPTEAANAVLSAAVGETPVPSPVSDAGADPWEHPDTKRRFRVMENLEELQAALEAPWEKWAVFLHPAQQEYVDRDFIGPARVIGSAGTGKTVVALHRAARLALNHDARVLLTTFNRKLADSLRAKLPQVASRDALAQITVEALPVLISRLHHEAFGASEIIDEASLRLFLEDFARAQNMAVDADFLFDEWSLVVDAWNISSQSEYRDLPRLGRKVRMAAARRDALWEVFAAVRTRMASNGLKTEPQLAHELAQAGCFPFDHVLIDEAQDISVAELKLLGTMLGNTPNGLFFAGDIGQRIFRAPFPWTAAGVDLRGRSRSLKVNYRTSHQIRSQSDRLLPETLVEADGNEEGRKGITSIFDGPSPTFLEFESFEDEMSELKNWISARVDGDQIPVSELVILVRHSDQIEPVRQTMNRQDLQVLPMHDAKGAEFRAVAIAGLNDGVLPDENRLIAAKDEAQLDEIMNTERHLLYVAATRARDHLWMSGVTPISEYFADLIS
ncbi:UvrD-helicase domain-containing protein [Mameliella alba]|nr:UvrD-helicase domain-containing protein [Mameliella alba]MBY6172673.1 UvrD-helicase domain-containing protein [Mameliella alba]MBY6177655.1 UvrD-helicase domain-containing protein [Mameliella alba]